MILHYLYVEKCGILNKTEFNLSDKYHFHFDPAKRSFTYDKNPNALSDHFFSYDSKHSVVDCVSALVGDNGAGKTTVANILASLTSNIKSIEHIIIFSYRQNGKDKLCYHFQLEDITPAQATGIRAALKAFEPYSPDNSNPKLNDLAFVYATNNYVPYSPIPFMDNTINLSTSYLMKRDFDRRKNPAAGEPRDEVDSRYHDQMELIRMVNLFASSDTLPKQQTSDSADGMDKAFNLPCPTGLTVKLYNYESRVEGPLKELVKGPKWIVSVKSFITHVTNLRTHTNRPEHYLLLSFLLNFIRHEISESNPPLRKSAIVEFVRRVSRLRHTCSNQADCDALANMLRQALKSCNKTIFIRSGETMVPLYPDKIIDHLETLYHWLSEQNLPPSSDSLIQQPTVVFSLKNGRDVQSCLKFLQLYFKTVSIVHYLNFEFTPVLSAGEMSQFALYARLYNVLKDRAAFNSLYRTGDVVLFFDEIEITIHPDLQRQLVSNVILFLERHFPRSTHDYRFHVIFASHSPILLSDIPADNVTFLKRTAFATQTLKPVRSELPNTFAANIHALYRQSFFMSGLMGSFAQHTIEVIARSIEQITPSSAAQVVEDLERRIAIIGEPFMQKQLMHRLSEKCPGRFARRYYELELDEIELRRKSIIAQMEKCCD